MKAWPEEHKTADFDDIVQPIVSAVKFTYNIRRKNQGKDVPYDGLPLTSSSILAGCPQIAERLEAANLAYDEEDQGRPAIEVIIGCAVQLGIEQGLRIAKERNKHALMFLTYIRETLEEKP